MARFCRADVGTRGLVYASVRTGYPPADSTPPRFETYEPEAHNGLHAGHPATLAQRRLRLDVELFCGTIKPAGKLDPARPLDPATQPQLHPQYRWLADARVEVELGWRPTPTTALFADIQYLDADYRSFKYIQGNPTGVRH